MADKDIRSRVVNDCRCCVIGNVSEMDQYCSCSGAAACCVLVVTRDDNDDDDDDDDDDDEVINADAT